jgi:L-aminopeptidase/D-esterase-like protein
MLVLEAHAVLLTGGSAFGLAAADGVMTFLEDSGVGFDAGAARVPIVPAAVLFDLGVGDPAARPGPAEGRAACDAATNGDIQEGNVGAGTGATVAKVFGPEHGVKGGLGSASAEDGDLVVGALAAVNALGEIVDADGELIAASRIQERPGGSPEQRFGGGWPAEATPPAPGQPGNTTLVVVATNAKMSRERAHLLAQAAHEGISAAVRPAHTIWDGDTVFTLATGQVEAEQRVVETLAVAATSDAIRRAVLAADGIPGFPQAREVPP